MDASAPVANATSDAAATTQSAAAVDASATGIAITDDSAAACGAIQMPFEAKIRPDIKKCFFDAKVKNPALTGKVKVVINVGPKGEIQAINIVDKKELGAAAVACMTKVVTAAKFDGSKCANKAVQMPMAFGAAAKE